MSEDLFFGHLTICLSDESRRNAVDARSIDDVTSCDDLSVEYVREILRSLSLLAIRESDVRSIVGEAVLIVELSERSIERSDPLFFFDLANENVVRLAFENLHTLDLWRLSVVADFRFYIRERDFVSDSIEESHVRRIDLVS